MDISHFINSIEPGETIVEEKQMQGKEFITRENEHIKVCFLLKAPCSKDGFLKTEITNNTNDTITYISNTFLRYRESNNSWIPLDRKSTRLNSSHMPKSRMPSSA